eukprot:TRINITY_DN1364_c0_g1_i1.p1 TRINITY_DN1364_c0_g1~~TRINITY_DN1364_c0_g1_i1.p1  ORF type:complete len:837 (+),score=325.26 TRINITY_DN1364_c0_g1_i1:52-2562(+)
MLAVTGFDFGNSTSVIAIVRRGGIDIITNEASGRETKTVVGFKENKRNIGESGATSRMGNIQNTIVNFKHLLGRKFSDPDIQEEIKDATYKCVELENGEIGIQAFYKYEQHTFTATQIAAMMLTQLKQTTEASQKVPVKDVVLTVPLYFTDKQRRALKDAAKIAGLNALKLISEPAAIGLQYGLWKKDLGENAVKVMFADFGESSLSVSLIEVESSKLSVIESKYIKIGGRDFDKVLFDYFAKRIQEKYKLNVYENKKAKLRLMIQCERVKKILTANPESNLSVECIMNDIDVYDKIDRETFKEISADLITSISNGINQLFESSQVDPQDLYAVEIIGGASHMKLFQEILIDITKKEISHTQNKTEGIACGCALQCAMLSPQCKVKEFSVSDVLPYSIKTEWILEDPDENEVQTASAVIFKKNRATPCGKKLTFPKANGIRLRVSYANPEELPFPEDPLIAEVYIPPVEDIPVIENAENVNPPKVEVKLRIDRSGIFKLEYANLVQSFLPKSKEEDEKKEETKTDEQKPEPMDIDNETSNGEESKTPEGEENNSDSKSESKPRKRKLRRTELFPQVNINGSLSIQQINELRNLEQNMIQSDQLAIQTSIIKNNLETYIYDMQGKLQYSYCELFEFIEEESRNSFLELLDNECSWLYGEGDSVEKEEYELRLSKLKSIGDPVELRKKEHDGRDSAVASLFSAVEYYLKELTESEKYSHIDPQELKSIEDKVNSTQNWLNKLVEKQNSLPKHVNPVLLNHEINTKVQALRNFSDKILSTPKPEPKPQEAPEVNENCCNENNDCCEENKDCCDENNDCCDDKPSPKEESKADDNDMKDE